MRGLLATLLLGWLAIQPGLPVAWAQQIGAAPLSAAGGGSSKSTNQEQAGTPPAGPAETLLSKLAQARADLSSATDSASVTNSSAGVSPEDLALRRALLDRLVRLYEKELSDTQELEAVKERRTQLRRTSQDWTGFAEPRPYSILLTDGLREELQSVKLRVSTAETALEVVASSSEAMKKTLAQSEEEVRQLNEQLENAGIPSALAHLTWSRGLKRLQSRVAAAGVSALDNEFKLNQERLAENRLRLGFLSRQLVTAETGVTFTQADLDKVLAGFEEERVSLERELAAAEALGRSAGLALDGARERVRQATGGSPVSDSRPQGSTKSLAVAWVEVRQTQAETAAMATEVLRLMLEGNNVARTMWELRYASYGSGSVSKLQDTESRLDNLTRRVALWKEYFAQRLEAASGEVDAQQARLLHLGPESSFAALAREQLDSFHQRQDLLLRTSRSFERLQRLATRFREDLQNATSRLPLLGRLRNLFSSAGSFATKAWNFELLSAEDTIVVDGQPVTGRRSVTLGKVLKALVIFALGFWLTGWVSRAVEPLVAKRLKIETNQASLIRRWVRIALLFALIVFSLMWVKIPLTIFAFAGGALAIGVGFGTQTLLKNFISGVIILFERPFRVGDVLDVDGQRGKVTGIGIRSSVIRLWDNTEILIPNSEFLERRLINWTFSNSVVRFTIPLGVAYGTDTRRVIAILTDVAERHDLVEKDPKPQAFMTSFDDSSLGFELRFWADMLRNNPAQISSDLRQMIASAFAEQGIIIPFPQRDVHFDPGGPPPPDSLPNPKPKANKRKTGNETET